MRSCKIVVHVLLMSLLVLWFILPPASVMARQIRVGYAEAPGYISRSSQGNMSGVIFHYLESINMYADNELIYVELPPERLLPALASGEVDMLAGVPAIEAYDISGLEFAYLPATSMSLFVAGPGEDVPVSSDTPLVIGYLSSLYEPMVNYPRFKEIIFPQGGVELRPYTDKQVMLEDCRTHKIQGYLTCDMYLDDSLPLERSLGQTNVYITFRKDNGGLAEEMNRASETALQISPKFRDYISVNFHKVSQPLLLTPEERAWLAAHPVIRAAALETESSSSGFPDGMPVGLMRRIMEQMESDLGIEFEYVKGGNTQERLALLESGEVDLHASIYGDFAWASQHNAFMTNPYLFVDYLAVFKDEPPEGAALRIAYPKGNYFVEKQVRPRYPEARYLEYDSTEACFEAVADGKADLTFGKAVTVQQILASARYPELRTGGNIAFSHPLAMGISKHTDQILLNIINKELVHIGADKVDRFMNEAIFSVEHQASWRTFLKAHPISVPLGIILVAAAIIGSLLYIMYIRNKGAKQLFETAFVNPFTSMMSVRWFETFVPGIIKKQYDAERREGRLFIVNIIMEHFDVMRATYAQKVICEGLKKIHDHVGETFPWILERSISYDLSRVLLLGRLDGSMSLQSIADRMMGEDTSVLDCDGTSIRLDRYMGIAMLPSTGETFSCEDLQTVIVNASVARNEALLRGKHVGIYNSEIQERRKLEKRMEDLMEKALENDEFQVWLQPKYNLASHKIVGAESLVRWQSPELGFLMPGQFINLFEQNGFILTFDYYMLEHVCRLQKERLEAGLPIVPIAVNQSGLHMREADYLERMQDMTELYDLPKGSVELEITETALIDYESKEAGHDATAIVAALRKMGYVIAMDDFCTGYSSIAMLHRLPMDIMKIDRSMLLASEKSSRGEKILKNVIGFGLSLDMKILCEGIETKEQEELLTRHNCQYGQGFLFGKPMPLDKFETFVKEHDIEAI